MKNKTIRITANELQEADVTHISLVPRGANRLPLKIFKREDNSMKTKPLNLDTLFRREKAEPAKPELIAIAVKSEDAVRFRKPLEDAGFVIHAEIADPESGAVLMTLKEDACFDDASSLKMSDEMVAVVSHVSKISLAADSSDFADNMSRSGFLPSARLATDMLMETMWNIMVTSYDPAQVRERLDKALADFAAYMQGVVAIMPETVFKLEGVKPTVMKIDESFDVNGKPVTEPTTLDADQVAAKAAAIAAAEKEAADKAAADKLVADQAAADQAAADQAAADAAATAAAEAAAALAAGNAGTEGAAGTETAVAGGEGGDAGQPAAVDESVLVQKEKSDVMAGFMEQMQAVLLPFITTMSELKIKSEELEGKLALVAQASAEQTTELTQKADKALAAVRGTLVGGAGVETRSVVKEEQVQVPPVALPKGVHLEYH